MIKILFVCHGNICRSPMAEYVMKDLVARRGIEGDFLIESAATSDEEIGNNVYPPVRRLLAEKGVPCPTRKARRIRPKDAEEFDYLIGMDNANMRNMRAAFGETADGKMFKLLDFAGADAGAAAGADDGVGGSAGAGVTAVAGSGADDGVDGSSSACVTAGAGRDVADPWYSRNFEQCYADVMAGCEGLLRHLKKGAASA